MQLNKQDEKLLQELLKKYKQGIISGFYSGNNITFTPTGCRDKIISSTSSGTGGGIQSIQEGDNITVDNTDPQNPIISATGGGSSELFPNGFSEETVSRELTSADIGKLLIIVNDDVILTPASDMVSTGDLPKKFGIWCLNPTTKTSGFKVNTPSEICYLESATAFDGATGSGEIVSFMTLYDDDLVTSNIYPITDIMLSNEFTGTVGQLAIPYLLEQSQNAIPLSGTKAGKPVTGDIELYNTGVKYIYQGNLTDGPIGGVFFDPNTNCRIGYNQTGSLRDGAIIEFNANGAFINDLAHGIGLQSALDYSSNITDLDYTQKKYVGFRGTATLSSGTVTVATDKVLTGYKIYVSVNTPSGTQGFLSAPTGSIVDATEFVINSTSATDNSTVNWWIAP